MSWWLVVALVLLGLPGCAQVTQEHVRAQVELLDGAVAAARDANLKADVAMWLETQNTDFYARQSFGWQPPVKGSLLILTHVDPADEE